jgi:hypothetical protein
MAAVIEYLMDCQSYRPGDWTAGYAAVKRRCGEVPESTRVVSMEGVIKMMTRKVK